MKYDSRSGERQSDEMLQQHRGKGEAHSLDGVFAAQCNLGRSISLGVMLSYEPGHSRSDQRWLLDPGVVIDSDPLGF